MASRSCVCALCGKEANPRNRLYLKKDEDLRTTIRTTLLLPDSSNKGGVEKYLDSHAVICRTVCKAQLMKLGSMRKVVEKLNAEYVKFCSEHGTALPTPSTSISERQAHEPISHGRRLPENPDTPTRATLQSQMTSGGATPVVSVLVKKRKGIRLHRLSRSLKTLGRSVGRRDRRSIVNQVMNDRRMRQRVIEKVANLMKKELLNTLSPKSNSMFMRKDLKVLENFSWSEASQDAHRTIPTFCSILDECIGARVRKKYKSDLDKNVILSVLCGILLRSCSQKANAVQRLFSVLLYASHAPKQIFKRLQKPGICLSFKSTVRLMNGLGKDYDKPVKSWRDALCQRLWPNEEAKNGASEDTEDCVIDKADVLIPLSFFSDEAAIMSDTPLECLSPGGSSSTSISEMMSTAASESPESATVHSSTSVTSTSSITSEADNELHSNALADPSSNSDVTYMFKIVGDNIDKTIRPRQETMTDHTQSLHYFHAYAVRDRCDLSTLQDTPSLPSISSIDVDQVLPDHIDERKMIENMTVLIKRVVLKHAKFFQEHLAGSCDTGHIRHTYTKAMSSKSEVIPLGVMLKNEIKREDMVSIMDHLQQYVPLASEEFTVTDPDDDDQCTVTKDTFHYTLFGGDQLTMERAFGSKKERSNEGRGTLNLEGLVPVIEDWHAKVCMLKSIWKILYKTSSGMDQGTLYQLRNALQRRTVTAKIKSDPTACEEFFLLVVEGHILSLVMQEFQLSTLDGDPAHNSFATFKDQSLIKKREIFSNSIEKLVAKFVNLPNFEKSKNDDHVVSYSVEVLSLGLLYMEFTDAIREGDGERILRCWRYMFLLFKVTGKRKYTIQAFNLLAQYHFLFTERMRHQLLWSRTVNVHGRIGKNIPMDLHMEHLNRELKNSIGNLGSNVTDKAICRIAECLKKVVDIKRAYDLNTGLPLESGKHSSRSLGKDLTLILEKLNGNNAFKVQKGRCHSQFRNLKSNTVAEKIDKKDLHLWMTNQIRNLLTYML